MKKAHLPRGERSPHIGFRNVTAEVDSQFEGAVPLKRYGLGCLGVAHGVAYAPWNVRLITSICCSRVNLTKFTAYPETRIVRCGYSSGCSIVSRSVSRFRTLTFM